MARKQVTAITSKVLRMIFAAAKDSHPNEFACMMRAEDGIIIEIILVPGTVPSERYAIFKTHMLPVDFSIVGSAHSHPTPNARPSDADLQLFQNTGPVHIIVGFPYEMATWRAYDRVGNPISLEVI